MFLIISWTAQTFKNTYVYLRWLSRSTVTCFNRYELMLLHFVYRSQQTIIYLKCVAGGADSIRHADLSSWMAPQTAPCRGNSKAAPAAKTIRSYKNCGIPDELLDGIFELQEGKQVHVHCKLGQRFQCAFNWKEYFLGKFLTSWHTFLKRVVMPQKWAKNFAMQLYRRKNIFWEVYVWIQSGKEEKETNFVFILSFRVYRRQSNPNHPVHHLRPPAYGACAPLAANIPTPPRLC